MKIIRKISSAMNMLLGYVTFAAFFVIMAFIVINVFMRFVLDSPVLGAYEIVEQMMFVGVFCSFAYAQQQGSHIRVSMLLMHLPRPVSMALCGLTSLLGAGILGVAHRNSEKLYLGNAEILTHTVLRFRGRVLGNLCLCRSGGCNRLFHRHSRQRTRPGACVKVLRRTSPPKIRTGYDCNNSHSLF